MNINGKNAMVFKNEKDGRVWFNISDGSKNVDGSYTNYNWNVRFKKDNEPIHKSKINYEGFTSYYKKDEKTTYVTLQIMDWDYADKPSNDNFEKQDDDFFPTSNIDINESDLPF